MGRQSKKVLFIAKKLEDHQIVDLCSGGGGAILSLHQELEHKNLIPPFSIVITDKFPNTAAFDKIASPTIIPIKESVDATNVPKNLRGFRTLFSSFHHFKPNQAKLILKDAVEKNTAIGVFEMTKRSWKSFLILIIGPIQALVFTPFIRPFRWSRIFWTYIIPIVPIIYAWDGLISNMRSYTIDEMKEMTKELKSDHYKFEMGHLTSKFNVVTYLIGYPIDSIE